ncbi:lysophospholipid acyltransferase family protein [Rhodocista pekingensis]|uniref:Lysophospholipid acyltransferase family protein n=1 Tax=Rhodocista pekingensis TaxID=201185 RepID=A0ABW2L242_9PROT
MPTDLPDPDALRSPLLVRFFTRVMARHMASGFHAVRLMRPGVPTLPHDRPVIVYCNHPSWWDPAFLILLASRAFPERRGFGPMDAAALARYRFMARIGLFPVEPDTAAGAVAFMKVGQALLSRPDAMLWVTAEGRFSDPRSRPVRLRGGIAHLACRLERVTLLPLALEYPFWEERTPEALARFGTPLLKEPGSDLTPGRLQEMLEERLEAAMDDLAVAARSRDPDRFATLLGGRVGVGGVYDLWRRGRAWAQGQRFDPAHGSAAAGAAGRKEPTS